MAEDLLGFILLGLLTIGLNGQIAIDYALVSHTLDAVTETTKTCIYCGSTFEMPEGSSICAISRKDPVTKRPTGERIIMVNGIRVHECWHDPYADKN